MEKGVMFKVWAANAKKCFVLGAFNNWSSNKNRLKLCLDGYFRGFIEVCLLIYYYYNNNFFFNF